MESQRVDSVRLSRNGVAVGRIAPWAGAEPLTAEHLRTLLIRRYPGVMLGVLASQLSEAVPPFLRNVGSNKG
ncbi:MAG: hypothetical protein WKF37_14240 [Bryobacteraceae bacterium]